MEAPTSELRQLLTDCLRICHQHRWVAEWLFTDLTNRIIRHDHVAPPLVFDQALHMSSLAEVATMRCDAGSMCYVPIAQVDGIVVGYCFNFHFSKKLTAHIHDRFPFQHPFIARFVYNKKQGDFLVVTCGGTPKSIGISGGVVQKDVQLQHTFVVDADEYRWDALPTEPLIVLRTVGCENDMNESKMDSNLNGEDSRWMEELPMVPITNEVSSDLTDTSNSNICKNTDTELISEKILTTTDHTPWMINSAGYTSDGVSMYGMGDTTDTSSSMFNMDSLKHSLDSFVDLTVNKPFQGYTRLDTIELNPVIPTDFKLKISIADERMQEILRNTCKQIYYQVVLSINIDSRVLQLPAAQTNTYAKIAPRPADAPVVEADIRTKVKNCKCKMKNCVCERKWNERRTKILEDRRKRNRLSAARSNERRKAWLNGMKEEIEETKKVVVRLEERKKEMILQNESLKTLLGSR